MSNANDSYMSPIPLILLSYVYVERKLAQMRSRDTIDFLQRIIDLCSRFFGYEYIDLLNEQVKNSTSSILEKHLADSKSHPLGQHVASLQTDLSRIISGKSKEFSRNTAKLALLCTSLELLEKQKHFNRIIMGLKNKNEFYSTLFESKIATVYELNRLSIYVLPESNIQHEKTTDFLVTHNDSDIYIECKSLDDMERKQSHRWQNIFSCIADYRSNYGNNSWDIKIKPKHFINHKDQDEIISFLKDKIRKNDSSPCILDSCTILIENYAGYMDKIISRHGGDFIESVSNSASDGLALMKGIAIDSDKIKISDFFRISTNPHEDNYIAKRIINVLKKARKQIPIGNPGIVYVELPYEIIDRLAIVIDFVWDEVHSWLNKNTKRINAVVLSYSVFQYHNNKPIGHFGHTPIPNYNSAVDLPRGFRIVGTTVYNNDTNINAEEGSLLFRISDKLEFKSGIYEMLFGHDTPDAQTQLRFFKTHENKIRLEFVSKETGRYFIESNVWEKSTWPAKYGASWCQKRKIINMGIEGDWYEGILPSVIQKP